jgi:indolepyruvate ferredoxin oxidoreductase beta subunit
VVIAALGGQGGGVLADWIVHAAEAAGWIAQMTSVPGVAQRTGTTIYYVEVAPPGNPEPVLALMPVPGDVDVAIGAELMEAGRAILRGFVTPDRTTLIASTHRVYGITEKAAMGDGVADGNAVLDAARASARHTLAFDMQEVADQCGAGISSVLLGALASSGVLPFGRAHYEQAIREYAVAVDRNLAGFAAAMAHANTTLPIEKQLPPPTVPTTPAGRSLDERVRNTFPAHLHGLIVAGCARVLDYQDSPYATLYLDRLARIASIDTQAAPAGAQHALTSVTARYLALWMTYEDTYRVAELKTRATRFKRFRDEVRAAQGQIVYVTEFMHPRWQEVCESLPAAIGRGIYANSTVRRMFEPLLRKGRHVPTTKMRGFLPLWILACLGRFRRGTWRYAIEQERIEAWLKAVAHLATQDYWLAVEIAECQRLVTGYGETHERGMQSFRRIVDAIEDLRRLPNPADGVRKLRTAALADEDGRAFAVTWQELAAKHGFVGESATHAS